MNDVMDELGPIDYVVIEFPAGKARFSGEMAEKLKALVEGGIVRILDLLIITKDADGNNALTEALERVNGGFLRLNLLLLLLVAFLPYPARVMQEYLSRVDTESGGERTAVAFFGIVLFLMSLMLIVLGRYAEREGLFCGDAGEERLEDNRVKYQLAPSLIFYPAFRS